MQWLLTAILLICYIGLALALRHDLHMLQQNSYRNERYRRWRAQHSAAKAWRLFRRRLPVKKQLVMTARAKRLYSTALAVAALFTLALIVGFFSQLIPLPLLPELSGGVARILAAITTLLALALLYFILTAFSGYYLLFINWLLQPLEKRVNQKYLSEAKKILAERPGLKRVGISGSYGKTSCKMILNAMLSEQYLTLATPESVNTPMGVTRVIREQLKPIHQVFICEMGAKQAGDIAELCALVQPQTGILTAIGPQHLETFGSEEAIAHTKFELIRALPNEGLAVLNLGNETICARLDQAPCRVVGYGLTDQPYHAEDIRYSAAGAGFTLVTPKGERQPMVSRLLGRHNIENIVGATATAAELGLTLPQIARAVRSLTPLPHRLQLLAGPGYTIIDDAFNSNPQGAAAALFVLSQMGEGQKILITPGLVELGEKQQELNRDFARLAAAVCDHIILVGKKHSLPMQEGLREAGFSTERYAVAATLAEARHILTQHVCPGDAVLFENDLPDMYNE